LGRAGAPANLPPARPTQPAAPIPCSPVRLTRPFALSIFAEQALTQENAVDVVRAPGLSESGLISGSSEQIGLGLARGVTPWLNLGVTLAWRRLEMQGRSRRLDLEGNELSSVTLTGAANKARALAGALFTFGPSRDPTAFRIGVAYDQDLFPWSVE